MIVLRATVARCAGASNACLPAPAPAALLLCQRNALNALLYRTGEASKNFMLVLATNRPDDLDSAVVDRVDEAMHFDLPPTPAGWLRVIDTAVPADDDLPARPERWLPSGAPLESRSLMLMVTPPLLAGRSL